MLFKSDFDCQSVDCSPDVNCLKCGLYKNKHHPKQNYTGEGKLKCLIIAEAPGEDEDRTGTQLVGDVGKWFRRKLAGFGLSLDRDFWKMNSVSCRPTDAQGNNRKPTPQEIQYCRARVLATIEELKPRFIWLMGNTAIESFYSDYYDSELLTIGKWRRNCIPDPEYGAYIVPLWHPSYVTRNEKDQNLQSVYIHDLMYAVGKFDLLPFKPLKIQADYTTDFQTVIKALDIIVQLQPKFLYFDYETNCLKPQLKGSKVATISFCISDHSSFSFPYDLPKTFTKEEREQIKMRWINILNNPNIAKGAHSCQFENNWSCKHFTEPKGWFWDTQLTSHVLDNRRSIYGLKFQAYLKLGIKPYDKEITPYLEADGKNKFNDIDKAPLGKLLTYNAMDTFCGWHLKHSQVGELIADRRAGGRLHEANKFFLEGALALSDMERAGLRTDPQYYKVQKFKIEQRIEETKKKILVDPLAVKFRKQAGRPMQIKKNVGAEDLRYLLEKVMKVKIEKLTATELTSTDSEVLTRLKTHPIIENIISLRSDTQLLKTYIMGYLDWAIDGIIYPQFSLQIPTSYRSSARNPNIQNVPKRLQYIRELIRRGILPRIGRQLGEMDFSGIEVAVGCCYHKDPKMISYLTEGGDMHRDAGADIWLLPVNEIAKQIRFFIKNQWVFPQFYGSTFHNCSRGLWETSIDLLTVSGEPLREHMRVKGIKTLNDFTDHLKDCQDKLWHRFRVYKKWKDNQEVIYRAKGFIETFMGFKFTDYMGYNELSNYPVQGTAFHVLLWTYIQINKVRREEEWRTKIPAEVHDSMMFDFHPKEVAHVIKTGKHIAEVETRKAFEWINIPIKIETELAPVGGSWNDLKPYEVQS